MFSGCLQDFHRMFSGCFDGSCGPGGIWWSFQWPKGIQRSPTIWWSPAIRWSIVSMDFDNPKVYGDTFISDGLVTTVNMILVSSMMMMLMLLLWNCDLSAWKKWALTETGPDWTSVFQEGRKGEGARSILLLWYTRLLSQDILFLEEPLKWS